MAQNAAALDFRAMTGEADYRRQVQQLYAANKAAGAWQTPSELFKPHYSAALAKFMLGQLSPGQPLTVVEVGGGSGSNAKAFLDFVRTAAPDVYCHAHTSYTVVDISPGLHSRQLDTVADHHTDGGVFQAVCMDATDAGAWEAGLDPTQCSAACGALPDRLRSVAGGGGAVFVLLLEVLDNLPHDKVVWNAANGCWNEVLVDVGGLTEVARPAEDPVVRRALQQWLGVDVNQAPCPTPSSPELPPSAAALDQFVVDVTASIAPPAPASALRAAVQWLLRPDVGPPRLDLRAQCLVDGAPLFLPTSALQLVEALAQHVPGFSIVASDFDRLPPPTAPAPGAGATCLPGPPCHNAPLVSGRDPATGAVVDYRTYLDAPAGTADVFWATDFPRLAHVLHSVAGKRAKLWTPPQLLGRFGDVKQTTTRSGWNPMLQDFSNTLFLTAT